MKVKLFFGRPSKIEEAFNKWAKNLMLNGNTIIHTIPYPGNAEFPEDMVLIAVYYPNWIDSWQEEWRKTKEVQDEITGKLGKAQGRSPP